MIKEIQFQYSKQKIFAMDENYNVVGSWECRSDFEPGRNDKGLERESLPRGTYNNIKAEITLNGENGPSYGNFYITTGDYRNRDIHGGGNGWSISDPYADYQGWLPTYGCLRMQNADGVELCKMILASKNVTLTVVD